MQQEYSGSLVANNQNEISIGSDFFRSAIHKMLSKIQIGSLKVVEENFGEFRFGDTSSAPGVVIHVIDNRTYKKSLLGGTIGVAEAYMYGWWTTNNLTGLVELMLKNKQKLNNMDSAWSKFSKAIFNLKDRLRFNSISGAKKNIAQHYDLSNAFFQLFLDKHMQYSSGIFDGVTELSDASEKKLDVICDSLKLTQEDHLVEIGSGWGGLAIYLAKKTGCKVTTTTISEAQYSYAKQWIEREGLENRITILKKDYRELEGRFDKLVSVEMVEAIGYKNYANYFQKIEYLLKPKGRALIQAITNTDSRFPKEKDQTDFIRTYIFPGGCLPSNLALNNALSQKTRLNLIEMRDLTEDYSLTLKAWKTKFFENLDGVRKLGFDEVFINMWDFYLSYCEGAFKQRVIHTSQFLYEKP